MLKSLSSWVNLQDIALKTILKSTKMMQRQILDLWLKWIVLNRSIRASSVKEIPSSRTSLLQDRFLIIQFQITVSILDLQSKENKRKTLSKNSSSKILYLLLKSLFKYLLDLTLTCLKLSQLNMEHLKLLNKRIILQTTNNRN